MIKDTFIFYLDLEVQNLSSGNIFSQNNNVEVYRGGGYKETCMLSQKSLRYIQTLIPLCVLFCSGDDKSFYSKVALHDGRAGKP